MKRILQRGFTVLSFVDLVNQNCPVPMERCCAKEIPYKRQGRKEVSW